MNPNAWITTSWDDGHPLDFRLADLLQKNGIAATFYIPKSSQNVTMPESQVRELSSRFEIGAHTLKHTFLDNVDDATAEREIVDSKAWVEEVTGNACKMFCPPAGKFAERERKYARQAGYLGLRTVELMSLDQPREGDGLWMMPTTLQAFPHKSAAYIKNAARRRRPGNLWNYVVHGHASGWDTLATRMLDRIATRGGVFHLWGHSWEIEETAQWERLTDVLRLIGTYKDRALFLTNSQVCEKTRGSRHKAKAPATLL